MHKLFTGAKRFPRHQQGSYWPDQLHARPCNYTIKVNWDAVAVTRTISQNSKSCYLNVLIIETCPLISVLALQVTHRTENFLTFTDTHTLACNYRLHCGAKISTCSLTAQCVYDNYDSVHVAKLPNNYMLVCK